MGELVKWSTLALETAGVGAIMLGVIVASVTFVRRLKSQEFGDAFRLFRADLGRGTLISLELLIAADILRSLVISPQLESIGVLAGIILVRTFLSLSLQVEIDGYWPWSRPLQARSRQSRGLVELETADQESGSASLAMTKRSTPGS